MIRKTDQYFRRRAATPGETREECEDIQFLASIAAGINEIEIAAMRWEYA